MKGASAGAGLYRSATRLVAGCVREQLSSPSADVVPLQTRSSSPTVADCWLGGYPAGRDWWGGKRHAGGMSEDHDRCFSMLVLGAFSTGVFNTNALPRINIDADVWGESSIMTGVY